MVSEITGEIGHKQNLRLAYDSLTHALARFGSRQVPELSSLMVRIRPRWNVMVDDTQALTRCQLTSLFFVFPLPVTPGPILLPSNPFFSRLFCEFEV